MISQTRPKLRMFSLLLLIFLLFTFMLPVQSLAAEDIYEGKIELSGSFNGTFNLDSSDMELFNLRNVVPGDTWQGKVHVKNNATQMMEVSIISIVSNLEDLTLYDALDLKISIGSEEIYNGSYGATQEPISQYYQIAAGERITFDIVVSLPKTVGNYIQNKTMDSTWTFEAHYHGSSGPGVSRAKYTVHYVDEEGNDLLDKKTGRGYIGSTVTEIAPDIKGYTVDAKEKSISLRKTKENKIVFVYSLDKVGPDEPDATTKPTISPSPTDPSQTNPPEGPNSSEEPINPSESETPDIGTVDPSIKPSAEPSVKTGADMTGSNSVIATWLFVFGLCLIGGLVLYFRIRAEKKRIKKSNSNGKEGTSNVKE